MCSLYWLKINLLLDIPENKTNENTMSGFIVPELYNNFQIHAGYLLIL